MTEKTGKKHPAAFPKGKSGNPKGRPRGALNKTTLAVQALLDGEAEGLTRKAVEMALSGDMAALRLCLERIAPPKRDAPVSVDLPPIESAADLPGAVSALLSAAAGGEITPSEAERLARLVGEAGKALELADIETRLAALEAANAKAP